MKIFIKEIDGSVIGNKVNLCDSCKHEYPVCVAGSADVFFGDGTGNDNVCCCALYAPIKCKNKAVELGTNLAEVGTDCISRQAAIDALDKRFDSIPIEQTTEILLLRKDLRDLPTAEPQRIKGKWALQSDDYHEYYECDQCGIAVGIDDIRNFCPNCGADMEVTT